MTFSSRVQVLHLTRPQAQRRANIKLNLNNYKGKMKFEYVSGLQESTLPTIILVIGF